MAGGSASLILGIDPGLAATGFALLTEGGDLVTSGTLRTSPGAAGRRLVHIATELEVLLSRFRVGEAALEELFMGRNRTSAMGVAQARGVVLLTLAKASVPVFEYKPAQVKSSLTGYGMATKAQLGRMLGLQMAGIGKEMDDHAADAVALAVCHSRSRRLRMLAAR